MALTVRPISSATSANGLFAQQAIGDGGIVIWQLDPRQFLALAHHKPWQLVKALDALRCAVRNLAGPDPDVGLTAYWAECPGFDVYERVTW